MSAGQNVRSAWTEEAIAADSAAGDLRYLRDQYLAAHPRMRRSRGPRIAGTRVLRPAPPLTESPSDLIPSVGLANA